MYVFFGSIVNCLTNAIKALYKWRCVVRGRIRTDSNTRPTFKKIVIEIRENQPKQMQK